MHMSSARHIRRIAAGPGRPRELSSWLRNLLPSITAATAEDQTSNVTTTTPADQGAEGGSVNVSNTSQLSMGILFLSDSVDRYILTYMCELAGGTVVVTDEQGRLRQLHAPAPSATPPTGPDTKQGSEQAVRPGAVRQASRLRPHRKRRGGGQQQQQQQPPAPPPRQRQQPDGWTAAPQPAAAGAASPAEVPHTQQHQQQQEVDVAGSDVTGSPPHAPQDEPYSLPFATIARISSSLPPRSPLPGPSPDPPTPGTPPSERGQPSRQEGPHTCWRPAVPGLRLAATYLPGVHPQGPFHKGVRRSWQQQVSRTLAGAAGPGRQRGWGGGGSRVPAAAAAWRQLFPEQPWPDLVVVASGLWDLARMAAWEPHRMAQPELAPEVLEGWVTNFSRLVLGVRRALPQSPLLLYHTTMAPRFNTSTGIMHRAYLGRRFFITQAYLADAIHPGRLVGLELANLYLNYGCQVQEQRALDPAWRHPSTSRLPQP
ncbi:hypothetical protein QJQ45_002875 [Haematococcus lacustris]|nr:hypothetical protein QJQ45_002875 [Haematococcus lacustris]